MFAVRRLQLLGSSLQQNRALSEVRKAQTYQIPTKDQETIIDKIVRRQIPAKVVYQDQQTLAFHDINPQAPIHIVLVPKSRQGLTSLDKAESNHKEILGHLMWAAAQIARKQDLKEGWRLVVNNGVLGCQSIYHLHIHILGGRQMQWPPG